MSKRDVTLRWNYDEAADVLYLSFGAPVPAVSHESEPGVLVRLSMADDEKIVGLTLLGAKAILREKLGGLEQ